jgi:23S rRNA pseudouridine1911/1915/1917 synthase
LPWLVWIGSWGFMSEHHWEHLVPDLTASIRLDKYLADSLNLFPRSQYERREVFVSLVGKSLKPSAKLVGGELLSIRWTDLPELSFGAEDIALDVLYEDEDVVVVNKPRGMVVHPAHGHWSGTLVQALLFKVKDLAESFEEEVGSEVRPGIVHRLDKDTSGVLIAAKTPAALEFLASQFRDRSTVKTYFAVVKGSPKGSSGVVEGWLGRDPKNRQRFASVGPSQGKPAVTVWNVVARVPGYTLVLFHPHTGRTHQLRVHSLALGCPILGDPIYARTDSEVPTAPLMLHAARLSIELPGGLGRRNFTAPFPPEFQEVLSVLGLPNPLNDEPG